MSRTAVPAGSWTEITTTTGDVLFGVEGADVRFQTGSTSGVDTKDGHLVRPDGAIIFPTGLTVSATCDEGTTAYVTAIAFG